MINNDMPIIIPLLATGYLLTIYLLLMLAQWTMKSSRYVASSMNDAYAPFLPTEETPSKNEVKRLSLRVKDAVSLTKRDLVLSNELMLERRPELPNLTSVGSSINDAGN